LTDRSLNVHSQSQSQREPAPIGPEPTDIIKREDLEEKEGEKKREGNQVKRIKARPKPPTDNKPDPQGNDTAAVPVVPVVPVVLELVPEPEPVEPVPAVEPVPVPVPVVPLVPLLVVVVLVPVARALDK